MRALLNQRGLLAVLLLAAGPAEAATRRSQLKRIQAELGETRRRIEEYREQEKSLGKSLHDLEARKAQRDSRVEQLSSTRRAAQRRQRDLEHQLASLRAASGSLREALVWDIKEFSRRRAAREDAYGRADLWSEAIRRAAISGRSGLLRRLQGLDRKTTLAWGQTRRSAQELETLGRRASLEASAARSEYIQKKEAFTLAQEKAEAAVRKAAELEESALALTRLLNELDRGSRNRTVSTAFNRPRNSLPWPVKGRIVEPFGRRRNEELGTWVIRQGLGLVTDAGAVVSAVESGRVVFAGRFRSYGQVVIVDHGSAFYSIYGELGEILVRSGSSVKANAVIAKPGPGASGSGRLYLELRHGSQALDPVQWLKLAVDKNQRTGNN